MLKWKIALYFTLAYHFILTAQNITFLKSINLNFKADKITSDPNGNLFVSDISGSIYKFDNLGNLLCQYTTFKLGKISHLEADKGLRVFAFYQDLQEYLLLDQFLGNERRYSFNPLENIKIASLSQDLNLWVISDRDFELKKLNQITFNSLLSNTWVGFTEKDSLNIIKISESKSILYVFDSGMGIHLFDNLVNYLGNIETKGAIDFCINEGRLYILYPDKIEKYNKSLVEQLILPKQNYYTNIEKRSNLIYLKSQLTIDIFKITH